MSCSPRGIVTDQSAHQPSYHPSSISNPKGTSETSMSKYAVDPSKTMMLTGPLGSCIMGVGVVAMTWGMMLMMRSRTRAALRTDGERKRLPFVVGLVVFFILVLHPFFFYDTAVGSSPIKLLLYTCYPVSVQSVSSLLLWWWFLGGFLRGKTGCFYHEFYILISVYSARFI